MLYYHCHWFIRRLIYVVIENHDVMVFTSWILININRWQCNLHSANIGIDIAIAKHSFSIGIGIVIAKHIQHILSLLLELQINFSSIDVKIVSEITLFLDNTGHLQMQNTQNWYP